MDTKYKIRRKNKVRLWHKSLIPYLDRQHLLGQHRECCALRGKGWGRKHATVDYVFKHEPMRLFRYHFNILIEMANRGYNFSDEWIEITYRGKSVEPYKDVVSMITENDEYDFPVYPEHNDEYLIECLENLDMKNAPIDWKAIKDKFEYERKYK